jgi:hypothetical protein
MKSQTVPRFWKLYGNLSAGIQKQAREAYRHFKQDPAHPGLHFHRLEGHPELWSARVTRDYRVVGLQQGDTITWFWIGNHQEFSKTFGH